MMNSKKGEGEITRIAIGLIIIAMFSSSLIAYMVDVQGNYNLAVNTTEFETFNKIAELQGNITIPTGKNIEQDSGDFGPENDEVEALLRAGFKSTKLLFAMPGLLIGLVFDAGNLALKNQVGIPPLYFFGTIAIISTVTIFTGMTLIFKVKP